MSRLISYQRALKVALVTVSSVGAPLSLLWVIHNLSFNPVIYNETLEGLLSGFAHHGHRYFINFYDVLPGLISNLVAILGWEIFGFLAVLFPLWLLESTRRVQRLSSLELPFSPILAALAFFIPLRQIILPHSVLNSLLFRVSPLEKSSKMVTIWWLSWITMFFGAAIHVLHQIFPRHYVPWNLEVTLVYGSATVFCALTAALVLKFERNAAILEQQAK